MHETDLAELSLAFGALQVDARLQYGLSQLILKLDERFVTREEFEEHSKWLLSQQTAAWDRMMDHSHGARGELVFPRHPSCPPATEHITVCDSEVGCVTFQEHWVVDTVTATQRGCKCPLCYSVVQPRAKCECDCEHPCHNISPRSVWIDCGQQALFCSWCGNPLAEKEEKP